MPGIMALNADNTFFKSAAHKRRFLEAVPRLGKTWNEAGNTFFDQEYASMLYILTADQRTWRQADDYVSGDGIDVEALLAERDFSGGYTVLLQWAGNLFNERQHIDPIESLRLDEENFQLALYALLIRRYGFCPT